MTWACSVCTYINSNDDFLACGACGSERVTSLIDLDFPSQAARPTPEYDNPAIPKPNRAPPRLAPPQSPINDKTAPKVGAASSHSSGSPTKSASDLLKPLYQELVETERVYVRELQAVEAVFLLPLKARAQEVDAAYLSESEVNAVFGNIAEILRVNQGLLSEFDKALVATPDTDSEKRIEAICKAFLLYSSHLKMYAVYAIHFDEAQAKLKKFETERFRFAEFINSAAGMNDITANQPLASFLIKPIQRICKYPLFFTQMLKIVDEPSSLHDLLKRTLAAASEVASRINADKLRAEQNYRAFEVAKRFENLTDLILEPGRRYLGEWKCFVSEGSNSMAAKRRSRANRMVTNEKKARTCFLFTNCLLITKEVGTGPKLRYELKLWMSLDQLQYGGIRAISSKSRDSSSTNPASVPDVVSPVQGSDSGSSKAEGALKAKLFQLPLELVHVASSDREKTSMCREKQQQGQTHLTARRPSFLKKKQQNGAASPEDTIITSYTMWFRSNAERMRVSLLIEKALEDFSSRISGRDGSLVRASSTSKLQVSGLSGLPPMSPSKRAVSANAADTFAGDTTSNTRGWLGSTSEDSAPDSPGTSGKGVRRADSLDSALDKAGGTTAEKSSATASHSNGYSLESLFATSSLKSDLSSMERSASAIGFLAASYQDLFPSSSLQTNQPRIGTAHSMESATGEKRPPALNEAHMRRRSSARPRPPPPPPPFKASMQQPMVLGSSGIQPTPVIPSIPPSVTKTAPSNMFLYPNSMSLGTGGRPVPVVSNTEPEDYLISKWFGE